MALAVPVSSCELGFRTGHFGAGCPRWDWVLWHSTGCPCKFFANLVSGLGTSVLAVMVGIGCYGTGCPCNFFVNLVSGLGTCALSVLVGAGCYGTG